MLSLCVVPHAGPSADPDAVLGRLGASDGRELGARLLRDALEGADGDTAEMALIVTAAFGVSSDHLDPLLDLATAGWHRVHEDVATELGRLKSPAAVEVLHYLAQWIPAYLDFDESRALAVKAVWALGGIPGDDAERALVALSDSDSDIVRVQARRQRERRRSG